MNLSMKLMLRFFIVHCCIILIQSSNSKECATKLEWSTTNGKIFVNGQPLILKGIVYSGFQTKFFAPYGLLDRNLNDILDVLKENNFNAIQICISMELISDNPTVTSESVSCEINPGFCGAKATSILDIFIRRAAARGLLVVLSNTKYDADDEILVGPPLWYDSKYSEELVMDIWSAVVDLYKHQWNVFAIDLKHDPNEATWGNSSSRTDWNKAAERFVKRLDTFNGLFFIDGIDGGKLMKEAGEFPIKTGNATLDNRIIYTPSCYLPSYEEFEAKDFPSNFEAILSDRFAFLAKKGFPVLIGVWEAVIEKGSVDEKWNNWFINWTRMNCLTNNFYWDVLALHDYGWVAPDPRQLDLLNRMQPNPTKFESQNGKICLTRGQFPEKQCQK